MWTTISLFLQYSYLLASVQRENCSHNDKSFLAIPNMPGSIGPKWFRLQPPYNLGSVHTTISDTWIIICFTIYSNSYKNWFQTTSVFIECFSSLITKHTWCHNRHNLGCHQQKWPLSAPHEALHFAPTLQMNRLQLPEIAGVILGGLRVCMALKALLCSGNDELPQHWSVLRAIHTLNSPKIYIRLLWGLSPIHRSRRCGVQGLMRCTKGPFLPAAVMVGFGCVGQCWPMEANVRSIYCRNSKNCLRRFFISYVYPIHS